MSLQDAQIGAAALSEALPFIQKFRGQTFVIKYGGSAMESEEAVERLLRDVVFLEAVGINPVLVHGGGKAISAKMREAGIAARFVNGLRVTDEASIRIVEDVLDREVNPRLVKAVGEFGGHAQGFSGRDLLRAEKLPPVENDKGVMEDLGFVGRVIGVETAALEKVLREECLPVVSPVGKGADGKTYNINADEAAAEGTLAHDAAGEGALEDGAAVAEDALGHATETSGAGARGAEAAGAEGGQNQSLDRRCIGGGFGLDAPGGFPGRVSGGGVGHERAQLGLAVP